VNSVIYLVELKVEWKADLKVEKMGKRKVAK
jgi:hypothetical protein